MNTAVIIPETKMLNSPEVYIKINRKCSVGNMQFGSKMSGVVGVCHYSWMYSRNSLSPGIAGKVRVFAFVAAFEKRKAPDRSRIELIILKIITKAEWGKVRPGRC